MPGLCTFCDEPLDDSEEHILLSAIGGQKRSRRVICGDHNNKFGSSIDRALTEQLAQFSNLLAIRTGRGEEAATLRDLVTMDGTRIDLEPGGRLLARPEFRDEEIAPGKRQIQISAASPDHLRHLTATYMKKYGRGVDGLEGATIHETITRSAPVKFDGQIGGESALRAVAKMGLLLLGATLGTDAVRGADTQAVRHFITVGGDASEHIRFDYVTDLPVVEELSALPDYSHTISAFACAESGVAVAYVELFGTFRYVALLSTSWTGPSCALFYGVDPVTGDDAEARTRSAPPLSEADFRALGPPGEVIEQRLQCFFALIEKRRMDVSIEHIAHEIIAEVITPDRIGTPFTSDDAARIAAGVTERLKATHFGGTYSKQLDAKAVLQRDAPADTKRKSGRARRRKR